jgi:hypothetical protein
MPVYWLTVALFLHSSLHNIRDGIPNVIVVIPPFIPGDKELYDRKVYTAITRAKENLIIINANERYWKFGEGISDEWR